MIQIMHEALNWTENHCNETKKKYDTLKGYDSFMDLVEAYVAGANRHKKEEIMEKAEKAYCKKCAEYPCAIIIRHGCLCMQAEMFLKELSKEL